MKNKGRRWKRAEDALKKRLDVRYTKGYVMATSKHHPNYFTAMIWDSYFCKWEVWHCGYISAYMNPDGTFIKW